MNTKERFLSILISLVMLLGLIPGMSLAAYADEAIYNPASEYTDYDTLNANDTTVQIPGVEVNGTPVDWYVIGYESADKTVTLLSKQSSEGFRFILNRFVLFVGTIYLIICFVWRIIKEHDANT